MRADAESSCTESCTDSWSPDGARNPWSAPATELWAPTGNGCTDGGDREALRAAATRRSPEDTAGLAARLEWRVAVRQARRVPLRNLAFLQQLRALVRATADAASERLACRRSLLSGLERKRGAEACPARWRRAWPHAQVVFGGVDGSEPPHRGGGCGAPGRQRHPSRCKRRHSPPCARS